MTWSLCVSAVSACSGLDPSLITATPPAPTETPFQTPTIVWFPPSATPSPAPLATLAATPEMRPRLGETVLNDQFTNPKLWDTITTDRASAVVDRNRLTLAVHPGGITLVSFRRGAMFANFYAEITAKPSLCRGSDLYGFLVRGRPVAYYRFGLSCDGLVRADRISVDTRRPLQEAVQSGDVPPGAPGEVRIGVWASGTEMRLFLNGRYQFSISDTNLPNGSLGAFVQSTGDTPVTVTFSDLVVQEVEAEVPADDAP